MVGGEKIYPDDGYFPLSQLSLQRQGHHAALCISGTPVHTQAALPQWLPWSLFSTWSWFSLNRQNTKKKKVVIVVQKLLQLNLTTTNIQVKTNKHWFILNAKLFLEATKSDRAGGNVRDEYFSLCLFLLKKNVCPNGVYMCLWAYRVCYSVNAMWSESWCTSVLQKTAVKESWEEISFIKWHEEWVEHTQTHTIIYPSHVCHILRKYYLQDHTHARRTLTK